MEFKAFPKMPRVNNTPVFISQKLNGTNACIHIYSDNTNALQIKAGSRNRWLTIEDDNFGFAKFVSERAHQLIEALGEGTFYGEFVGPGINSSEGLKTKQLFLFDTHRLDRPEIVSKFPNDVGLVPILWKGSLDTMDLLRITKELKINGSKLVPGFMGVEGIVINILGFGRIKFVFEAEETQWRSAEKKTSVTTSLPQIEHLLQPIRLEKLLSRDESYTREYPNSLPKLCSAYIADLIEEGQITGDADQIKAIRKALGSQLFAFIKHTINQSNR
jgi:hypothetical protein